MSGPVLFSGLDLGQTTDFTALAVLEQRKGPDHQRPGKEANHYEVRHLERFQLGTSYTTIVARVAELFSKEPLAGSTLAVDQTGVGRPVVDMLRAAKPKARLVPVTITAGATVTGDTGGYRVPKADLVGALLVLLQSRRIKWAPALPNAHLLATELSNFRTKVSAAGNESFEAWRESDKDDLVLATGIAAWAAERPYLNYAELIRQIRANEEPREPSRPVRVPFLVQRLAQGIHGRNTLRGYGR